MAALPVAPQDVPWHDGRVAGAIDEISTSTNQNIAGLTLKTTDLAAMDIP